MRIFITVSGAFGSDYEWQVEVDLATCRALIHRRGVQVATARYGAGSWHDVEPDAADVRAALAEAIQELKPFRGLLKRSCRGGGATST